MGMLAQVKAVTSKMISLTLKAKEPPPTTQSTSTSDSVPESGRNGEAQDDLGAFGADDIQALLRRMNYNINFILFGVRVLSVRECDIDKLLYTLQVPLVASVSNVANESENGWV
ncbi:hypothetical protein M405DRAFT_817545 [Rhizopogon salebrosus TDB-379]|nr:hypothetical protein M405DRAFT_817545 [Rhizopogon salebrosus TDB-379]